MGNIVSIFSKNPFIGTWVDDRHTPYEVVISAEDGKFTLCSKMVPEEGVIVEYPDEKLNCIITNIARSTLEYVAWYDSIGRRCHRILTANQDKNLLLVSATYSDSTLAKKISTENQKDRLFGSWEPVDDDFWMEYRFTKDKGHLQVSAFDTCDNEYNVVKNIQSGEDWISFETETLSDGRRGKLKFAFNDSGTSAIMYFTFTEFYRLHRQK